MTATERAMASEEWARLERVKAAAEHLLDVLYRYDNWPVGASNAMDQLASALGTTRRAAPMPRIRTTGAVAWLCCLDCGSRWVGGDSPASRVCVGYEDEGCGSRRVVREVNANRYFARRMGRRLGWLPFRDSQHTETES